MQEHSPPPFGYEPAPALGADRARERDPACQREAEADDAMGTKGLLFPRGDRGDLGLLIAAWPNDRGSPALC